jgi:hypothetical protein
MSVVLETDPLAATAARLAEAGSAVALRLDARDAGWVAWDRLASDELLTAAYAAERAAIDPGDPAACAAASLGFGLGWLAIAIPTAAIVRERRCPDFAPANLLVRSNPEQLFEAVGLRRPRLAVLPDDPAAGHRDAIVLADLEQLRRWFAERAVACLEPVLAAVARLRRIGLPALWGSVGDSVCAEALWAQASPEESLALVEALAPLAPRMRTRPTFAEPDGMRRGTCCLYYRTAEARAAEPGEQACGGCPLYPAGGA